MWHETRVAAPADATYASALALDLQRSPLVRAIFRGRELLMGAAPARKPEEGFLREILAVGWGVLAELGPALARRALRRLVPLARGLRT